MTTASDPLPSFCRACRDGCSHRRAGQAERRHVQAANLGVRANIVFSTTRTSRLRSGSTRRPGLSLTVDQACADLPGCHSFVGLVDESQVCTARPMPSP